MTGKLHRALVVAASVITMAGGLIIITDPATLGISAESWKIVGGWFAFGGGIASGVVTVIRANLVPGMTTGVGNEPPNASVSTVTVKETTTGGIQ